MIAQRNLGRPRSFRVTGQIGHGTPPYENRQTVPTMTASLQRGPLLGRSVTLRGRLTTAFLAVVLGPVLLGSLFVGMTVGAVSRDRTVERLDHATPTVRTAIGAVCRQLQATAD